MKTAGKIIVVTLYVAMLIAIVLGMLRVRSRALSSENYATAKRDWKAWVDEAESQSSGNGPVQRRKIERAEPPTTLMMRDHFGVCLTAALLFSSGVYGTIAMLLWGTIFSARTVRPAKDNEKSSPSAASRP